MNGDMPAVTPCRATTKPSAQQKAAPTPQASPSVVELFRDWGMLREGLAVTIKRRDRHFAGAATTHENVELGFAKREVPVNPTCRYRPP
jgi:hypothetical protein